MGLFIPNFMSKDVDRSIEAIQNLDNQKKIAKAALQHGSSKVRYEAVKKLNIPSVLESIALSDADARVRLAAIKSSEYCDPPVYTSAERHKNEAIHLSDNALVRIAANERDETVAEHAIWKIRSVKVLDEFMKNTPFESRAVHAYLRAKEIAGYDAAKLSALFSSTRHKYLKECIVADCKEESMLIEFALKTRESKLFTDIVVNRLSPEAAKRVMDEMQFSIPICFFCGKLAFRWYVFNEKHICHACLNCASASEKTEDVSLVHGIVAGKDIPAGKYIVQATVTSAQGDTLTQSRGGAMFLAAQICSQYNEDGIRGRMELELLDGDVLKGSLCAAFQQVEVLAQFEEFDLAGAFAKRFS